MAEEENPLETYKTRATIFRVLNGLAALIFLPLAGITILDLFYLVRDGMLGIHPHFAWTSLYEVFRYGYHLFAAGIAYLSFGAAREHYEEKVFQLTAAAEALHLYNQQQHPPQR
jgi:hypothetical protein